MNGIEARAPARVDLAGGTLDIWPLYLFHENSQTINCAIQCEARCRITPRRDRVIELVSHDLNLRERFASLHALRNARRWKLPLPARLVLAFFDPNGVRNEATVLGGQYRLGFTLETDSEVPAGSGLGGSSALNIAICGALARWTGMKLPPRKMIEMARNVEAQVLGVPTGEQDYYSALFGGVQAIHLTPRGVHPERLLVRAQEINQRFVLCYTGESRNSGINNWEVEKAHIDGRRAVIRHFDRIAAIAADMRGALLEHDWKSVARLLEQEWQARTRNHPGITTPRLEKLMALARRNGAMAGKVCGAGGGGCVVFLADPERKQRLEVALAGAGATLLQAAISARGLRISHPS